MPSLKEYNTKLTRLRSTRKLTRTMKLVSANKLRRAQEAEKRVAAFAGHLHSIVRHVSTPRILASPHPLLVPRRAAKRLLVLVIASDRGLCGGFNNALLRETLQWIAGEERRGRAVRVSCCGRKAHAFLRNRCTIERFYEQAVARPDFAAARQIGHECMAGFLGGRLDEIHVASNRTGLRGDVTPAVERLIPLDPATLAATPEPARHDWLIEPAPLAVLESTLPTLLSLRLYQLLLSSATGEHGARMRAMDQAGSNADALIRTLTLQRNRARQARITTELTEIVAGAEALR